MKPNINYSALIETINSIPQEELLDRIETVIFRERIQGWKIFFSYPQQQGTFYKVQQYYVVLVQVS